MRVGMMHMQGRLTARPNNTWGLNQRSSSSGPQLHEYGSEWLLFVPSGADGHAQFPLLVMLHGAACSARDAMLTVQMAAEKRGFMVFAPQSGGTTWDMIREGFGPDFNAINEALNNLFDDYPIDPGNIAIGGFSDGASYALTLGLLNGDLFNAILAFSPGFSLAEQVIGRPRIYISHGRRDPVLPYDRCGAALARTLTGHGLDVRFDPFEAGHIVPLAQVTAATEWWLGR